MIWPLLVGFCIRQCIYFSVNLSIQLYYTVYYSIVTDADSVLQWWACYFINEVHSKNMINPNAGITKFDVEVITCFIWLGFFFCKTPAAVFSTFWQPVYVDFLVFIRMQFSISYYSILNYTHYTHNTQFYQEPSASTFFLKYIFIVNSYLIPWMYLKTLFIQDDASIDV